MQIAAAGGALRRARRSRLDRHRDRGRRHQGAYRQLARDHGLDGIPLVLSEALGRAFGVSKLPYAVLLDEAGKVASLGLVNSREHLESLFEAKERGVASIQDYLARRNREA